MPEGRIENPVRQPRKPRRKKKANIAPKTTNKRNKNPLTNIAPMLQARRSKKPAAKTARTTPNDGSGYLYTP